MVKTFNVWNKVHMLNEKYEWFTVHEMNLTRMSNLLTPSLVNASNRFQCCTYHGHGNWSLVWGLGNGTRYRLSSESDRSLLWKRMWLKRTFSIGSTLPLVCRHWCIFLHDGTLRPLEMSSDEKCAERSIRRQRVHDYSVNSPYWSFLHTLTSPIRFTSKGKRSPVNFPLSRDTYTLIRLPVQKVNVN